MLSGFSLWRIALSLGTVAVLGASPAGAADTGNGSKNFSTPHSVPNYFSNEAGPMMGPAYETQRGPLYMSQTYGTPPAAARVEQAARVEAPVAPQYRQRVALAAPRGRVIRGRRGERVVARHVAVHGRSVTRVAAHGSRSGHAAHVASHHRGAAKATRVSSSHRRARG